MPTITLKNGLKVATFTPPPRDFDPLKASPSDRLKHGFPPLSDATQLAWFKTVWARIKNRATYVVPTFTVEPKVHPNRKSGNNAKSTRVHAGHAAGGARKDKEPNAYWSGAAVYPGLQSVSFRWIMGTWTIPNISSPSDNNLYSCLTWIGIDGLNDGDYATSSDVCQIGIYLDVTTDGGKIARTCKAFYEWYTNDSEGIQKIDFPVDIGDTVTMSLCTAGKGAASATAYITNLTTGQMTSFVINKPESATFLGDCAEWVVESLLPTTGEPLANYSDVFFSDCVAAYNNADETNLGVLYGGNNPLILTLYSNPDVSSTLMSEGIAIADEVIQCKFVAYG
jgi:hypothetical protein